MPGRSGPRPYKGAEGTSDHNLLINKGTKSHNQLDVETDIHEQDIKDDPVNDDEVAIDDSEDGWVRKKIKLSTILGGSGTGGSHGDLTGLDDDDHLQYLTNERGDARYTLKGLTRAFMFFMG